MKPLDEKASLKRVLLKLKGEARSMRKDNIEARLNPKPKPEAEEPISLKEDAPKEDAETPDTDKKAARAKEIASIRSLLARV